MKFYKLVEVEESKINLNQPYVTSMGNYFNSTKLERNKYDKHENSNEFDYGLSGGDGRVHIFNLSKLVDI